ncbi:16S rRNA (guanine(527)-N(7))-methyltransferase RsmG [Paracoccus endophyticus]|uniref:16S rRNA (guanine(527)-N(7))-methyltransferase RsmG n=1 Tax=Paracoccus endophyticus TaxID=2233774 RepID=UPI000DD72022|nr:16S rRNA (guanine(527)-N(7))-methyltransferase RsmG [Paracoccus endophyticus]
MSASREAEQLGQYAALLRKWNPAINLVAPSTLADLESRHIIDSQQVAALAHSAQGAWLDLGSGGGLPGIVLAICRPGLSITLLDSDQRKAAFLRTAVRTLGLVNCTVLCARIEQHPPADADHISARALAPLDRLMPYLARHLAKNGTAWLMKGRNWQHEAEVAQRDWTFDMKAHPSRTEAGAAILQISGIVRRG